MKTNLKNKAGDVREGTGADNEVWSYGEDAEKIMVKFIHVRELMKDYIRGIMKEIGRAHV